MEQNIPARQLRTNRGMVKTVLLNVITLGIYSLVIGDENLVRYDPAEGVVRALGMTGQNERAGRETVGKAGGFGVLNGAVKRRAEVVAPVDIVRNAAALAL